MTTTTAETVPVETALPAAGDLVAVQRCVTALREQIDILARYLDAVATAPASLPVRLRGVPLPVRSLRLERGWSQAAVVRQLRQVADTPLPGFDTLLAQFKRWDRGEHAPSEFYARLLRLVFGLESA